VAALLSFLWPGLGQLYTGKRRLAALFAIPGVLILLALAFLVWQQGAVVFASRIFAQRAVGIAVLVIIVLFGVWRLASMALAYASGDRGTHRVIDRAVLALLAVIIVVGHASAGYVVMVTSNAGDRITQKPSGPIALDMVTPSPKPGVSPSPIATVLKPTINQRITILFTGYDSAPDRDHILYDSIMVVSYDPKTNSVQMVSVPRDTTLFHLYFSDTVATTEVRINELPKRAATYGSPDSGYMTLVNEVSYLVGIKIDYYAAMDLLTFVKMIDMVGGIDVINATAIDDPDYDWLDGTSGFTLAAGPQHLDGREALAYVRSRRSQGDNDFGRSSRQQEVLVDLMHKMAEPSQILALPGVIDSLGSAITTGCVPDVSTCKFPVDNIPDYISIGQGVPKQNIRQVVLDPSDNYSEYVGAEVCLFTGRIAALSKQLFGADSLWNGKVVPDNTCPA
jgi:LCP family protein required for cell wall assembly